MQPQLFFHVSEVQAEPGQAISAGSEVSFATVPDTQGKGEGNPIAVRIQLLPEGTLQAERRLPGGSPLSASYLRKENSIAVSHQAANEGSLAGKGQKFSPSLVTGISEYPQKVVP